MEKMVGELTNKLRKWSKANKKPISWLRFAKKTKYGFRFLANKEVQWRVLEKIAEKVKKKYPQFTSGQIVDMLSEIVNKRMPDE